MRARARALCPARRSRIKFGMFYDVAARRGLGRVATGHYARVETDAAGRARLFRAPDPVKDQTYFLCGLRQVAGPCRR